MGEYSVRCVSDGSEQPAYALSCPEHNSLLRAYYKARRLLIRDLPGMWKFFDWLPVDGIIEGTGEGSVTYKSRKSRGLAAELGLKNLYISFSGYWPERRARMPTCSFKDLEAPATVRRLKEMGGSPTLVVASAGNTARAFAQAASVAGQRLVLFVPQKALQRIWITADRGPVTLIGVKGDYFDAIGVADRISSLPGFVPEGGARNIARRDGMGTVMLEAALSIGKIPDHYFQAVGSGTGGISAWEAGIRLIADGRFGSKLPRLHLAQNIPNAPIYYAWTGKEQEPFAAEMFDDVLFNRRPPYAVVGGVKDALEKTDGQVYGISDQEAARGKRLFEETEEIDILNAPGVAVAALEQAARSGDVLPDDIVLLNITGGGVARLREELSQNVLSCDAIVSDAQEAEQFLEGRI
ncbi:MAG: cysteate synthase [Methanotrichaceae archaeon]|nr:cysteate synthase [Methanotrichaceae archaeon]